MIQNRNDIQGGAVYICQSEELLENKGFFDIMDRNSSIDIDEEIDFKMARVLAE